MCRVLGTFETVRSISKPEKKIENFTIISTFLCRFGLNICPKRPKLVHQTQKIRVFVTHTRYFCTNMKFETNPLTKSETFRDFRTLFKQQQSRQIKDYETLNKPKRPTETHCTKFIIHSNQYFQRNLALASNKTKS